ncbi:MAG: hypothetical protein OER56_14790 [Hyphomicrobiales bacterium]|nr:hypothetical protein [Hyphomicrobiales bacterium]
MDRIYRLYRKPEPTRALATKWNYLNRITDGEGALLYSGVTPNDYFKAAVIFTDASGNDALSFGANRSVAPGAFVSSLACGTEIHRIDLPVGVRLRPNASMGLTLAKTGEELEILPSHMAASNELGRLAAVFADEIVVRRGDETVAFTGGRNPQEASGEFNKEAVAEFAGSVLGELKKIPGNILKVAAGKREDSESGRLTALSDVVNPDLALTLLVFRTYIFRHFQNPQEKWWQGD